MRGWLRVPVPWLCAIFAAAVILGRGAPAIANGIDTAGTDTLPFSINGTQIMTMTANGLGIGTPVPLGALQVYSAAGGWGSYNFGRNLLITSPLYSNNPGLGIADTTGANFWGIHNSGGMLTFARMPALNDSATTPGWALALAANGYVGVNTLAPQTALDVNGSVRIGADPVCGSAKAGATRYNAVSQSLEVCNGTTWGPAVKTLTPANGKAAVSMQLENCAWNDAFTCTATTDAYGNPYINGQPTRVYHWGAVLECGGGHYYRGYVCIADADGVSISAVQPFSQQVGSTWAHWQ